MERRYLTSVQGAWWERNQNILRQVPVVPADDEKMQNSHRESQTKVRRNVNYIFWCMNAEHDRPEFIQLNQCRLHHHCFSTTGWTFKPSLIIHVRVEQEDTGANVLLNSFKKLHQL